MNTYLIVALAVYAASVVGVLAVALTEEYQRAKRPNQDWHGRFTYGNLLRLLTGAFFPIVNTYVCILMAYDWAEKKFKAILNKPVFK